MWSGIGPDRSEGGTKMKNALREQVIEWVAVEIQPAVSSGDYETIVKMNKAGWITPYGPIKLTGNELERAEARACLLNRDYWNSLDG